MPKKQALKKLHDQLLRRRDAIRRALAGDLSLLQSVRDHATGDLLDAAAETAQSEVSSQLLEAESRELFQIENALERIRQGNYGSCDTCGKPIPLARLEALPFANECIQCRRSAEGGESSAPLWNRVFDNWASEKN